jgi:hypothetical protein
MPDESLTLDQLGLRFGTDKASSDHNYLAFYERYFSPRRNDRVNILEVGIGEGPSLAVWEAYFPNATIIGADINPRCANLRRPRVSIEIIDQSNLEHLVHLAMKYAPFDIIVEDGSHLWEHQITTLKTLFPFVKQGGIYIVEDLQTNFGNMEGGFRGVASISCVEYLKKLVDLRVADTQIDIRKEEDAFLRTYGRAINTITFYRRACLIERGFWNADIDEGRAPRTEPYFPNDMDSSIIPVEILAHIGEIGDRTSKTGSIRGVRDNQYVQGFSIQRSEDTQYHLFYRARLQNGAWTDWVGEGEFAGTRGKTENLTGFSIRVGNGGDRRFSLQVVGQFSNSPDVVVAGDAEECVSKRPGGMLSGMEIRLRRSSS